VHEGGGDAFFKDFVSVTAEEEEEEEEEEREREGAHERKREPASEGSPFEPYCLQRCV
jgi:hypothetical protein